MRGALAILITLVMVLSPLRAATGALCAEMAPEREATSTCCPETGVELEMTPTPETPLAPGPCDAPDDGCDCTLSCCGSPVRTLARTDVGAGPTLPDDVSGMIDAADDDAAPDRRPDGVRRPPRAGLLQ